jgi:5-methyltetrahydrofolate--homocysteine methyltransferase
MIIIAENFNSSIPKVDQALKSRDSKWIRAQAELIAAAGADYIDVNAGTFMDREYETLLYLADIVSQAGLPLVIDSPDPDVIAGLLRELRPVGSILNSITLESDRFEKMSKLASDYNTGLIALLMDKDKMPVGVDQRLDVADEIVAGLRSAGITDNRIHLDPMVRPLAADDQAGKEALDVIRKIKMKYPEIHVVVGLSNLSYGLPARKYLNQAFLIQGMALGLDSAILNPLDNDLMSLYRAAKSLAGNDEFCCDYLDYFRPRKN